MKRQHRSFVSILLAVLLLVGVFPVYAQGEIDTHEQAMLRAAVGMTANMVANAIDGTFKGKQNLWKNRLAKTAFATPLKAVTILLTDQQLAALCKAMRTDESALMRALAKTVNSQYSEDYAAAADAIAFEDELSYNDYNGWMENGMLTLLIYDNDLSLTFAKPKAGIQSVFLMGMPSLVNDIDGAYIEAFALRFGITGVAYTLYNAPSAVMGKDINLSSGTLDDRWRMAVTRSDSVLLQTMPELYACEYLDPSALGPNLTMAYLYGSREDPVTALGAARFVARNIAPLASKYAQNEKIDWRYSRDMGSSIRMECDAPPIMTNEPSSKPYDPNGTIVIVYDRVKGDTYACYYEYLLESAFPLKNIPKNIDDADYILRLNTHWEKQGTNNGIEIFKACTAVTLHDAETGALVMKLGEQIDKLEGARMVMGNSYYESVNMHRILTLVREKLLQGGK